MNHRFLLPTVVLILTWMSFIHADEPKDTFSRSATYRNPILPEVSMADPHVLKFDGKYYLYPTSHTKGYDVFESVDLVHWTNEGTVFRDPHGGAWAPDVFRPRGENSKFYLYYTDNLPEPRKLLDKQIGVAVANNPLGPFEDRGVLARNAIDAHVFEDTDGKLYLYYVGVKDGFRILVQPMSDPLTPVGESTELCNGPQKLDHLIVCSSAFSGAWIRRSFDEQEATEFFGEFQGEGSVGGRPWG